MNTAQIETSQSKEAIARLKARLVAVDDNGFFNSYDHLMVCHGCGTFHAVRSAFISSPLSIEFRFDDGSALSIPCYKCPTCTGEAIREAWEKGVRYSVYNRAAGEIGAQPWPDPQPCRLCGTLEHPTHLAAEGAHHLCAALAAQGLATPALPQRIRL